MALSTTQHLRTTTSLRRPPNLVVLKPPTARMETTSLHLSVVDQRTPRVYTQTLLVFPFPDGNKAEAAVVALEDGLRKTLKKFPFLAGTLSLCDDGSGKLTLTYPTKLPHLLRSGLFSRRNIHHADFPYTYEALKDAGMPPTVFTPELFRPRELLTYAGIPSSGEGMVDFSKSNAPVFRSQANFIPGGLVLYMCFHHSVMDCSGITNFWTYFANEISSSSGLNPTTSVLDVPPDQSKLRRELDELAPNSLPQQRFSADAYSEETHLYEKTLADDTPCDSKLLLIPAAKVHNYRNHLKQYFPDAPPPSICNVIAALLWIYVTRARFSRIGPCTCTPPGMGTAEAHDQIDCEHKRTNIGIATDLRKRRDPELSGEYMGNLAIFSKGTLSIEEITAEKRVTDKTVVTVIKEIRRAIGQADPRWVNQQLGFFKSLQHIGDTECALGFRFGRDIYITSWMNFAADLQWNIPGTDLNENSLNGRADYIRRFHNPSDGGLMIMPRRRGLVNGVEAPYEILVRLANVDFAMLTAEDGGLREWYDNIV